MTILPPSLVRWQAATDTATLEQTRHTEGRGVELAAGAATGTITSPRLPADWQQAVPSWQADAPRGTAVEVLLRAEIAGRWTRWYNLGRWSTDASLRHSVDDQDDADARVATDTLELRHAAQALQWRVVLHGAADCSPALRGIGIALGPVPEADADESAGGGIAPLPVPELSQMVYPNGGNVWCSPTSLTMLLGYWYARTNDPRLAPFADPQSVPEIVAPAVYDSVYDGTGNWPFNTAFAATLGLEGYVLQLRGLDDVRQLLQAGVPLAISIRWRIGELPGAPVGHSNGHLIVVVGLTDSGDLIVNDPAADPRKGTQVRRIYPQAPLRQAWAQSGRTAYLVFPPGWLA
ncbi:MAG: peptidase C39 [Chloroflexi bacterium]|nr:MAG: peptidase C39 [Chloroflexota bacterium]